MSSLDKEYRLLYATLVAWVIAELVALFAKIMAILEQSSVGTWRRF